MPTFLQQIPLLTILGSGPIAAGSFVAENIFILDIKNVIIGEDVTESLADSFVSFLNLETVKIIGTSFTKIGGNSFYSLKKLNYVDFGTALQVIDHGAFNGCSRLSTITPFPRTLQRMGFRAFSGTAFSTIVFEPGSQFKSLDSEVFTGTPLQGTITFPQSLTIIGNKIFGGSNTITKIIFGKNLSTITHGSLQGMPSLVEIEIDPLNPNFYTNNNTIYAQKTHDLVQIPTGFSGKYQIPDFTSKLTKSSFAESTKIAEVVFGSKVTIVEDTCFSKCSSLLKITLGDKVESIGKGCFLESGLLTFHIPLLLTSIGDGAFAGCVNLINLTIEPGNNEFVVYEKLLYSKDIKSILYCPYALTSLTLHNNVVSIPSNSFSQYSNLKTIKFSDNLVSINTYGFSECQGITELAFPKSLVYIYGGAFVRCFNLAKITFPELNNLASLEWSAFQECTSLKIVDFSLNPNSADFKISDHVFYHNAIETVKFPPNLKEIRMNSFRNNYQLREITFDYESLPLGATLFAGCSSLKTINLNISIIGQNAFSNINGLEILNLNSRTKEIRDNAFYSCQKLKTINFNGITNLIIGTLSFSNCVSLGPSIRLPPLMNNIYPDSFSFCNSLLEILTDSEEKYKSENGILYSSDFKTLVLCPSGKSIVVTNEIIEIIGAKSFYGCSLLNSVIFGPKISTISDYCFFGCSNLNEVNIPISVRFFGNSPFMDCINLKTIYYCSKTENITLLSPNPIEDHVEIVVRYDFIGDTFLNHEIIKSTSIKSDHCPIRPTQLFSKRSFQKIRKCHKFRIFILFQFLINPFNFK